MTVKSKSEGHVVPPEFVSSPEPTVPPVQERPHWEDYHSDVIHPGGYGDGFHRTTDTHLEIFNSKYVEGAKLKSLEEIGKQVNTLVGIATAVGIVMLGVFVMLMAHMS